MEIRKITTYLIIGNDASHMKENSVMATLLLPSMQAPAERTRSRPVSRRDVSIDYRWSTSLNHVSWPFASRAFAFVRFNARALSLLPAVRDKKSSRVERTSRRRVVMRGTSRADYVRRNPDSRFCASRARDVCVPVRVHSHT